MKGNCKLEVKKLVEEGNSTVDEAKRKAAYRKAIHIITDKVGWLPLFTMLANYAWTREVNCKAYADEYPRLNRCSWR